MSRKYGYKVNISRISGNIGIRMWDTRSWSTSWRSLWLFGPSPKLADVCWFRWLTKQSKAPLDTPTSHLWRMWTKMCVRSPPRFHMALGWCGEGDHFYRGHFKRYFHWYFWDFTIIIITIGYWEEEGMTVSHRNATPTRKAKTSSHIWEKKFKIENLNFKKKLCLKTSSHNLEKKTKDKASLKKK